ncbi:MAG: MotA/TolQ/ExbB proton channel family protein [Bacteroidota bacterium]
MMSIKSPENNNRILSTLMAIATIAFAALLMTWGFMHLLDLRTFDWNNTGFEEVFQSSLERECLETLLMDQEYISSSGGFRYVDKDGNNTTFEVFLVEKADTIQLGVNCEGNCDITNLVLFNSTKSFWTGIRKTEALDNNIVKVGKTLSEKDGTISGDDLEGTTGIRWLQALLDVKRTTNRLSELLNGTIQLLIYLFSMITIALICIDIEFVNRNKRFVASIDFLQDAKEVVSRDEIATTLQLVVAKKQQSKVHPEFEPHIVSDALSPCLEALLTYSGEVNRGELLASVEAFGNGLQERLERRFQIIRYFVTTIPSLGFIGTVIGISVALGLTSTMTGESEAYERILANGNLGQSLNVAFDTTLIGLVANIALSFVLDWLENWEINFIIDVRKAITNRLSVLKEMAPLEEQIQD